MGKYQLDYKGMQQVERFHEKNSTKKADKKIPSSRTQGSILRESQKTS